MNERALKNDYLDKFFAIGGQGFYRYLICDAINKLIKIERNEYRGISPELECLNSSDKFLFLYRRENNEYYLDISRIFRKAGHKIYRLMLQKGMTEKNNRFLNLV
jgi:hypothetical protein